MTADHPRTSPNDEPGTTQHSDEHKAKEVGRAFMIGTGMFLPSLVIFLIGLAVILYFVFWR